MLYRTWAAVLRWTHQLRALSYYIQDECKAVACSHSTDSSVLSIAAPYQHLYN